MKKTPLLSRKSSESLTVAEWQRHIADWLLDGEFRGVSDTTLDKYRVITRNLLWFLDDRKLTECGRRELQQFLLYVRKGHEDPRGRWGNPHNKRPTRPGTLATYFTVVSTLQEFIVREEGLTEPLLGVQDRPECRTDQVQPFSNSDIERLRAAAKKSRHPLRDDAIVMLLLDSGLRASELCSLCVCDLDQTDRSCRVLGKGNKYRTVRFGLATSRVLWQYLKATADERESTELPVFLSDRGTSAGGAMTRSGLLQLIERLGDVAGIEATRCSPHTFRHTFAVSFLRNGGHVFAPKEMLGHTSLTICNRYVALANADIEQQHKQFSPADRLFRGK